MAQGNAPGAALGNHSDLADTARANARVREGLAKRLQWYERRQSSADAAEPGSLRAVRLSRRLGSIALVAVTLAYLGVELSWNLSMLETISAPGSSRDELEAMATHGRWLASCGLVWALLRSLLFSSRSSLEGVLNYVLFASSVVVTFACIGGLYDKAIASLNPSASMRAFELAAHRGWALKSDLESERQARVAKAAHDPTAVALWAIYIEDPTVSADAGEEYRSRRSGHSEDAIKAAFAHYPDIVAAREKLAAGGDKLQEFERRYEEYLAKSHKMLNPSFGVAAWRRQGIEAFAKATCGMLPIENATREQFAQELTKSCLNDWKKAGQAYMAHAQAGNADPVVFDEGGIRVRFSEVANLDEAAFTAFVRDRAAKVVDEQLPVEETVKSNERAHDVIASVIVPPLSMTLSMLGVIANAGGVLVLLFGWKRLQGVAAVLALAAAAVLVPATAPAGMSQAWSAFSSSHPSLALLAGKVVTVEQTLLAAKRSLAW